MSRKKPTAVTVLVERDRKIAALVHYKRGRVEAPGGKIDPGETPYRAAARELLEETGLHATRLDELCTMQIGDHMCMVFSADAAGQLVTSREGPTLWCTKKQLIDEGSFGPEMALVLPLHELAMARRR